MKSEMTVKEYKLNSGKTVYLLTLKKGSFVVKTGDHNQMMAFCRNQYKDVTMRYW